jgi:hypothetical protein
MSRARPHLLRAATVLLAAAALLAPALLPSAGASPADEAAVRAAVEQYLRSHATGEGAHVGGVFHPDLMMYWVQEGELQRRTGPDFVAGFRGSPAPDEAARRRWIESVDVTGTAAVAKVVLDYPAVRFTDYFTLLRIGGEWSIMNKTFHAEPKGGS